MAEITPSSSRTKKAGVRKTVKQSTRVDLTPMVDLGFLLITFFIFTTSMSQPNALSLVVPTNDGPPSLIKEKDALTLLLGHNNDITFYEGELNLVQPNLQHCTVETLRAQIINKKRKTAEGDMVIVIKPGSQSVYKDVVNVLDEMTINDIRRYALVDITPAEEALLNQ